MTDDDLPILLERIARTGDQAAYRDLVYYFSDALYQLAFHITGHARESEEIVSDAFLKVWGQREKLTAVKSIRYYLYTVTRNISLDYIRKYHKHRSFSLDAAYLTDYHITLTPENQLITAELARRIDLAVNALPPRCKLIFKLVKEDGLKHREVAGLLRISVKTVEAQMSIALRHIHEAVLVYLPMPLRT